MSTISESSAFQTVSQKVLSSPPWLAKTTSAFENIVSRSKLFVKRESTLPFVSQAIDQPQHGLPYGSNPRSVPDVRSQPFELPPYSSRRVIESSLNSPPIQRPKQRRADALFFSRIAEACTGLVENFGHKTKPFIVTRRRNGHCRLRTRCAPVVIMERDRVLLIESD